MATEKRCSKCGDVKALGEFHKNARAKDGRKSRCAACLRADRKAYCESHRVEVAASQKVYRSKHAEVRSVYGKA